DEHRAVPLVDAPRLPPGPLRRLRLRLPPPTGPATRPVGPSPLGPGPPQRNAVHRRASPGALYPPAGHRPAPGSSRGLRPGQQQRPGPHAAVPQEPQELGRGTRGGRDRWLEALPGAVGRIMVTGPPPVVHLPRLEGSAQGSSRRPAADAAGTGAAGQAGAQAQTGSAAQGPSQASRPDQQGEIGLYLQAPLFDREAAGADEPPGATRPGEDAELLAGVEGPAGFRGPPGDALRGGPKRGPGLGPSCRVDEQPSLLGGSRVGDGDGDAPSGEVRQDDRLPEEPGVPPVADE